MLANECVDCKVTDDGQNDLGPRVLDGDGVRRRPGELDGQKRAGVAVAVEFLDDVDLGDELAHSLIDFHPSQNAIASLSRFPVLI